MLTPDSCPQNYPNDGPVVQFTKGERPFSIRQNCDAQATTSAQGAGLADYERAYLVGLLASFPIRSLADLIIVRDGVATIRADIPLHALSLEDACTIQGLAGGGRLPAPPTEEPEEGGAFVVHRTDHTFLGAVRLTGRQKHVLGMLAQGKSNAQIGRALNLTVGTVKIHVTAIFKTLGVKNRTQAAIVAAQLGLEG